MRLLALWLRAPWANGYEEKKKKKKTEIIHPDIMSCISFCSSFHQISSLICEICLVISESTVLLFNSFHICWNVYGSWCIFLDYRVFWNAIKSVFSWIIYFKRSLNPGLCRRFSSRCTLKKWIMPSSSLGFWENNSKWQSGYEGFLQQIPRSCLENIT